MLLWSLKLRTLERKDKTVRFSDAASEENVIGISTRPLSMYLYQMGVVAKILNLVPNGIDITHFSFTALFNNTLATNNQALAVFSQ